MQGVCKFRSRIREWRPANSYDLRRAQEVSQASTTRPRLISREGRVLLVYR
jgi:hypothetical protein